MSISRFLLSSLFTINVFFMLAYSNELLNLRISIFDLSSFSGYSNLLTLVKVSMWNLLLNALISLLIALLFKYKFKQRSPFTVVVAVNLMTSIILFLFSMGILLQYSEFRIFWNFIEAISIWNSFIYVTLFTQPPHRNRRVYFSAVRQSG